MNNVLKYRKYFLTFSAVMVLAAWVCIAVFGLRPGIDLQGGTQWQVTLSKPGVTPADIQTALVNAGSIKDIQASVENDGSFLIKLPAISEVEHQAYLSVLKNDFGAVGEENFSSIGPAIGAELAVKSEWAIFFVLVGISIYIAYAFRKVSEPKAWKYGFVTLATLVHDVSIPAGVLAVLGVLAGVQIDSNFIVALLVVMGFSVHDTIVVFDRIRENVLVHRGKRTSFYDIVNASIKETFARSVNTSFTLFLVLLALMFFGPSSLFYFVLTILVGTIFGTYSSIFVASPLLYLWQQRGERKAASK
ncbi:protein translocase subunit SecF [Patescibacteria group bacterium]|nr:protein translocase subunit SecF [Patescibacteria group bacterium]